MGIVFKGIVLSYVFLFYFTLALGQERPPNVILIVTDDQGYGDLGITGNPHVDTPVIDALAKESFRFSRFYVSPVCAPTRASIMTGRQALRTGIRDTYNGGAMMAGSEITLAELLKTANYTTGIFGKWHLGDNYPSRPMDQGFDESLTHLAGGMGQVGDFPNYFKGETSYFDPVLWHNGIQEQYKGYCSDIFAQEAINFIETNSDKPFFCYLAFNAPHTPLQVPEAYYNKYKNIDLALGFDGNGTPLPEMTQKDKEDAQRVYAMINNIDDNLGHLLQKVDDLGLADNTVVIFITDNGPQQDRYRAGLRGRKGMVYNGGIRVPFFMRYPKLTKKGQDIDAVVAHIDILPTLADLCRIDLPMDRKIDGHSFLPLLEDDSVMPEDREYFFQWNRKYPVRYRNTTLIRAPYKLVANVDHNAPVTAYELFHVENDPYETHNLVNDSTAVAAALKKRMATYFENLVQSSNITNGPRIFLGDPCENPSYLNRNDASGERGIWAQQDIHGFWRVNIAKGQYRFRFKFNAPLEDGGTLFLETGPIVHQISPSSGLADMITLDNVQLPTMDCNLTPFYRVNGREILPFWVEVERLDYGAKSAD